MNEENLINYYNKFNEDKRLNTRHGIVEFNTTIKYVLDSLKENDKILEVGAGTGKYSGYLCNLGYDVNAIELVKHNLRLIEKNYPNVKSYLGNAIDLSMFSDNEFDVVLLFGPMYHLISHEEKIASLNEAKRVVKDNGLIFVSYITNDYALLKHGFLDNNYEAEKDKIDNNYNIISNKDDLYSYVRLDEINKLKDECNLSRIKIISQDGLTDYFRRDINNMSDELFSEYLKYHLSICERYEMLGYSSHILDILSK